MKPQRVRVLVNASSGRGATAEVDDPKRSLEAALAAHGISAGVVAVKPGDLRMQADQALKEARRGELDAVIIAGGDGSIRTLAGVFAGADVPLGIVPQGTFNHFAKDLGLPLTIQEAVAVIAAGNVRAVDVGEVNGRVFVNNSSIGIYPYLVLDRERRQRRHGLSKGMAMLLAAGRAVRYFPVRRLHIRTEQQAELARSTCVFIGNNEYRVSGQALGGRDSLDKGKLSLYIARQQSRLGLLWLALRCMTGLFDPERDLGGATVDAVDITSREHRLLVASDGEVEVIRSPLQYRIRPKALRVFAPAASEAS